MKPRLSIIIPVYNAADTLPVCLDSLRHQGYESVQCIFINDCSADKSLQLMSEFKAQMDSDSFRVHILNHEENKGVAIARNTGLDAATGEYVYFLDADDRLENGALALIMDKIGSSNADILGFSWYLSFSQNARRMTQPAFDSSSHALQLLLRGTLRWNLWLYVVRRSLYEQNNIRFIPGQNMGEDLLVMVKLFVQAQSVFSLERHLYHYRQSNANSLTNTCSDKHIHEVTMNVQATENYLRNSTFAEETLPLINYLKLNIKLPLLISEDIGNYKKWLNWFPESNKCATQNKSLSLRTRLLQGLAARKQFWAVKVYNVLVLRFIYGVLYR